MLKTTVLAAALTSAVAAQAPQVQISIAVRETGASGGSFSQIGGDGGFSGGIEWINRDGQTLTLDGTWQQFTFDLANDPITGFAGGTANNIIEGNYGTIEHIRILNFQGITDPIQIFVDDVTNTTTTGGAVNFGDFEGFNDGDEVMFQEPDFSGSTAGNVIAGGTAGVSNFVASRTSSNQVDFQFVDNTPTRWVRLTTFQAGNLRNPLIRFDDNSTVTLWLRGGKCQPNLGSNGPGTAIAEMCGESLASGVTSTYYTAGSLPGAAGALAISAPGGTDLTIGGGTLVSFTNNLFTVSLNADANGRFMLPIPGTAGVFDAIFQTVYLDPNQAGLIAITNAVQAEFGR